MRSTQQLFCVLRTHARLDPGLRRDDELTGFRLYAKDSISAEELAEYKRRSQ